MSVPRSLRLESEVSRGSFDTPAGPLAALLAEPPGTATAEPVLLVPGYTGSKEDFLPALAPLARAGYRAVAIDLRGQHESAGPDDPAAYTFDALAGDVACVLAALGDRVHLVGHSMGGLITRRAILAGARPLSYAIVGSGPGALGGERAEVVQLIRATLIEQGPAAVADAAEAINREDPELRSLSPEAVDFLRRRWMTSSVTGLITTGDELRNAADETDALAVLGIPTLVLFGAGDNAWPTALQREMAARLGAQVVELAGAKHSPACETPEAFVQALVSFWSRVPA